MAPQKPTVRQVDESRVLLRGGLFESRPSFAIKSAGRFRAFALRVPISSTAASWAVRAVWMSSTYALLVG